MTKFNVGDVVYLKNCFVESHKRYSDAEKQTTLAPGQRYSVQVGLAKDIPLTIARKVFSSYYVTNFTDRWGGPQGVILNGIRCKTWLLGYEMLENRKNTISLNELNGGLK